MPVIPITSLTGVQYAHGGDLGAIISIPVFSDVVAFAGIITSGGHSSATIETLDLQEIVNPSLWYDSNPLVTVTDAFIVIEGYQQTIGAVGSPGSPNNDVLFLNEAVTATLAPRRFVFEIIHSLSIAPSIIGSTFKNNENAIKLSDKIKSSVNPFRQMPETLTLHDLAVAVLTGINWQNPTNPSTAPQATIMLSCGSNSITLRVPMFGNTENYNQTRVQRYSRGGDLIVFNDPMWPNSDVIHFEFEYLSIADSVALLTFIDESLGRSITMVDYLGVSKVGYIITPADEVTQPKVRGFSAKFDFQVEV